VPHIGVGDVWVIAGQSNAAGYGKSPIVDPPQLELHQFHPAGHWRLASHPLADGTATLFPMHREGALPSHSPWLHFARLLHARQGYPIGLVPAALGGSALAAWSLSAEGHLLRNLGQLVDAAGLQYVRGVVWYQGESDTGPQESSTYGSRFAVFVDELRNLLGHPALPVITVQLNRCVNIPPGAARLRPWEWSISRATAGGIPNPPKPGPRQPTQFS